ncbi:CPBP family intramembrane metalloprotease [Candidatus Micrarchaeota archaeon]|nr:CPBP family intramembrane metalloprotease [Candidatus Micrarchaeota archaeon]
MNAEYIRKIAFVSSIGSFLILVLLMVLGFPGYAYAFPLHAFLISISIYFLYKEDLKTALGELGVPCNIKTLIIYAAAGLIGGLIVSSVIDLILVFLNINDLWMVSEKVLEAPRYIAMLLFIVPPISEELFFRGVLMKRFGILISTFIFAISHFFYGSLGNIIFAFFVGLVYAYIYKKSGSLLPGILAHATYNFIAVMAVLGSV